MIVQMIQQSSIRLYSSRWCVQCERAAALLERHGLASETIDIGDPEGCCRLHELTGGASVPQVIVNGRPVGGYDEIAALIRNDVVLRDGSAAAPIPAEPTCAGTTS
jgi:glutaredoxin 3